MTAFICFRRLIDFLDQASRCAHEMASKYSLSYATRGANHPNHLAKRLLELAETKKTNIVLSADLTTTKELLSIADELGPFIAVLKTHIDIVSDFGQTTIDGLLDLARKHDFLIFEDRKFVDIGNTVQKQYHGGALRISDWAHIVNASILAGEGIIEALDKSISDVRLKGSGVQRGILILAEMTSKGSLATGEYTKESVRIAEKYPNSVVGFVSTRELSQYAADMSSNDFLVFTTGVNLVSRGDSLGQQYQTPTTAIAGGADFLIAGRGIYTAKDPIVAAKAYRDAGWTAYVERIRAS